MMNDEMIIDRGIGNVGGGSDCLCMAATRPWPGAACRDCVECVEGELTPLGSGLGACESCSTMVSLSLCRSGLCSWTSTGTELDGWG